MLLSKIKENWVLLLVVAIYIIGKILLRDIYFFWDNMAIISKSALFLYDNNFASFALPLGMTDDNLLSVTILAFLWKIFGCNFLVTHIIFGIVGVTIIFQIYKLCSFFVKDSKILPFIFLLVISDTALVTQTLIIASDPLMLLFGFMSVNFMLRKKLLSFAISLFFLAQMRTRGLDLCIGIGLAYFIIILKENNCKNFFQNLLTAIKPFIPAILGYVCLYFIHGSIFDTWSIYREDPAWSEHKNIVGFKNFIKNVATLGRWFLDYGRIFIYIAFAFLFFKFGYKKLFTENLSKLWILFAASFLLILIVTLPFTNPFGVRYFIFQYIIIALIIGILIFDLLPHKTAKIICVCLIIGLWSGHFWRHPEKLSKAWDTTLAHIPYYELRKNMLNFLDENGIEYSETSSFFPASSSGKYIELNNDERTFAKFDLEANNYIMYSNIANWSDEDIDEVKKYTLIKEFKRGAVFIRLYKNIQKS